MDCREFRSKHVGFVDDLLSAVEMEAMQQHLSTCRVCSRHNTAIRRSLLVVRNLPSIEPSPDFMARLNERLQEIGPPSRLAVVPARRYPSLVSFVATAAGIAAVAVIALQSVRIRTLERAASGGRSIAAAQLPPGALIPASVTPAQIVNPAMVASVATGMPVWPAMLMVGQAPMRLASMDFHDGEPSR